MDQIINLASQLANAYKALAIRSTSKEQWEEAVKNCIYYEQIATGILQPHRETTVQELQVRLYYLNNQLNFSINNGGKRQFIPRTIINNMVGRNETTVNNINLVRAYQILSALGGLLGLIAVFVPWLISNGNYEAGWYSFFNSITGISTSGGVIALILSVAVVALIFAPIPQKFISILIAIFGIAIIASGGLAYGLKFAEFRDYQNRIGMQMVQNRPSGNFQNIVLPEPGAAIGIGPGIYISQWWPG